MHFNSAFCSFAFKSMTKSRNKHVGRIAGYGVSGLSATTSALALVQGKGISSLIWGGISAMSAALTNEVFDDAEPAKKARKSKRNKAAKPAAA